MEGKKEISFQFLNLNFIFRNSTQFDKVNWSNRHEIWKNADSLLNQSFCPLRLYSDQIYEGDLKGSHERTKTKPVSGTRSKTPARDFRENILSSKIWIILSYLWAYEQFSMREDWNTNRSAFIIQKIDPYEMVLVNSPRTLYVKMLRRLLM